MPHGVGTHLRWDALITTAEVVRRHNKWVAPLGARLRLLLFGTGLPGSTKPRYLLFTAEGQPGRLFYWKEGYRSSACGFFSATMSMMRLNSAVASALLSRFFFSWISSTRNLFPSVRSA